MGRLKAQRSARRTQSTKIINEVTTLLESGCNDHTAFTKVIDKLVASRDELQKINAELEDVIPVEDLEREYESAAHYDDQTLETLTRLRVRLEDLSVGSTVLTPPSTTLNAPPTPTTAASQSLGPPKLREQSYRLVDEQTVPHGCGEKDICLVIGSDELWTILSGDIIRSTKVQGLVAVKTTLGWTLQGPTMKTSFINGTSEVMTCVLRVQAGEAKGSDQCTLESFWSLDAMGIAPKEATHGHADTLSVFQRKLVNIGKRYQVAVTCKEPDIELLQDNYSVALNVYEIWLSASLSPKDCLRDTTRRFVSTLFPAMLKLYFTKNR
ncbi:hypothetical protein HPB49_007148 [Dermacentor silvarum]|uniref:Uncharacterized protein n=1 Tax=Dermacentor silvarum TaxID=543639 RepID=A0ACB8CJR7_DERSI|nr:hypothetical protein HPB49_007148 [Dermacentor silvarum]